MKIIFTKKQLAEYFPELEQKAINSAWLALNIINNLDKDYFDVWAKKKLPHYMYSRSTKRIDAVMWFCDRQLECHGVEAINKSGYIHSPYWEDTVGLYLNSGDVYCSTIVADIEEREFHLTTFADFVDERVNREYCCND